MSTATLPWEVPKNVDCVSKEIVRLPPMPMTRDEFFDFCRQNRKLRFERTAEGEILLMPPSGGESSACGATVVHQLMNWALRDGTGNVCDSSGGFYLLNGAMRAPDAAWVSKSQLENLSAEQRRKFLPLCPEFVVEVMSPSDTLRELKAKMDEWIANGASLGWLIDMDNQTVHVYRPGRPAEALNRPAALPADPELPGFVLDLGPIWNT